MSRLTEIEGNGGAKELILPCDCCDGDYLRASWEPEYEGRYMWLENMHRPPLRRRLIAAWETLKGRPVSSGEVILTPKTIAALREFLEEVTE